MKVGCVVNDPWTGLFSVLSVKTIEAAVIS